MIPPLARINCVYRSSLPASATSLLAYLAWRVDSTTGETFVGLEKMVEETRLSATMVKEQLRYLIAQGWLERRRRPNRTTVTKLRADAFKDGRITDNPLSEQAAGGCPDSRVATCEQAAGGSPPVASRPTNHPVSYPVSSPADDDHRPAPPLVRSLYEQASGRPWSGNDDNAFRKFQAGRDWREARVLWAMRRIAERAKRGGKQPGSFAYFAEGLRRIAENLPGEIKEFLAELALPRVSDDRIEEDGAIADLREWLKCEAAKAGLEYDSILISEAVDLAMNQARRKRNRVRAANV